MHTAIIVIITNILAQNAAISVFNVILGIKCHFENL